MTPFEMFLRSQSSSPMGTPLMDPAQPVMPRSPYLTPAMRTDMGVPFPGALMGQEMPGGLPAAEEAPAAEAPRMPRSLPAATPGTFGNGFTPASLALPRPIAKGRGPFDDFLATYNLGRVQPEQDHFAWMHQPEPPAERAMPTAQGSPRGPQMDPRQAAREAQFAQRYPRAMARIHQLRARSQQRGY